jgi:hypothetical protein
MSKCNSIMRVLEKKVLRTIFGPVKEELTGGWKKAHNERFHNLYSLPDIIRVIRTRRMRWTRRVAYRKLSIRSVYKNLVRKPEIWFRGEDNIKMDFKETV